MGAPNINCFDTSRYCQSEADRVLATMQTLLPNEVIHLILNGSCGKSARPLLDRRHRFMAKHACRQWYLCVTHPSTVDAASMRAQAPPGLGDAWVEGRLARVSVLVDRLALEGYSAHLSESWSNCVTDGIEALIGMTVGDGAQAADAFLRWASCLSKSLATRDWSLPLRMDEMERQSFPSACATETDDEYHRERRARRCLARLACRFGRTDIVSALFDRYNLIHASTVFRCVDDAVAGDHLDVIDTILCAIAVHASDTVGITGDVTERITGGLLFFAVRRALYAAARLGSIAVLRWLLADDGNNKGHLRPHDPSGQHAIAIRRAALHIQRTKRPWETLAAAHCTDAGVFDRSGLAYSPYHVGAAAIAAGRTDVIDWLAGSAHASILRDPDALRKLLCTVNRLTIPVDGTLALSRGDFIEALDAPSFERGIAYAIDVVGVREPTQAEASAIFTTVNILIRTHTALLACIVRRWLAPGWNSLRAESQGWILASMKTYMAHGQYSSIEHIVGGPAAPFCNLWDVTGGLVCHVYADVITVDKGISWAKGHIRTALWVACLCGAIPRSKESDDLCRDMGVPTESILTTETWRSWCTLSRITTVTYQNTRLPIDPDNTHADAIAERRLMDRMALLFSSAGLI